MEPKNTIPKYCFQRELFSHLMLIEDILKEAYKIGREEMNKGLEENRKIFDELLEDK